MIPLRFVLVVILFNLICASLVTAYPLEISPTKLWDSTRQVAQVFVHNDVPEKSKNSAATKTWRFNQLKSCRFIKTTTRLNEVLGKKKINIFSATDLLFNLPSLSDILQNNNKNTGLASISNTVSYFSNLLLDNENSKLVIQQYVIPFMIASYILSPITATQAMMISLMYSFTQKVT